MSAEVVGFMAIKDMYKTDPYFSTIVDQCESPGAKKAQAFLSFCRMAICLRADNYASLKVPSGKR